MATDRLHVLTVQPARKQLIGLRGDQDGPAIRQDIAIALTKADRWRLSRGSSQKALPQGRIAALGNRHMANFLEGCLGHALRPGFVRNDSGLGDNGDEPTD
jgi:hypothetical protein